MRLALFATLAALAAQTAQADERTYDMTGFDRIDAGAGLVVDVKVGDAFAVSALSEGTDLEQLVVRLDGQTLKLQRRSGAAPGDQISVLVTLPDLAGISIDSGVTATIAATALDTLDLELQSGSTLDITGLAGGNIATLVRAGSNLTMQGTCDALTADAASGSNLDAQDLACKDVTAEAASGSNIAVTGTDRVDASAANGSVITVHGAPATTNYREASGGTVRQM